MRLPGFVLALALICAGPAFADGSMDLPCYQSGSLQQATTMQRTLALNGVHSAVVMTAQAESATAAPVYRVQVNPSEAGLARTIVDYVEVASSTEPGPDWGSMHCGQL